MTISRLFASLTFVVAGLLGRALGDKLLSIQGGALAVAGWAQLASIAEVVSGVSLVGIGTALTVLSAGRVGGERLAWLKPALLMGLALSFAVAAIGLLFIVGLGTQLVPGEPWLPPLALLNGWLAVAPGLLVALLLGTGSPGRATVVVTLGFMPPLALLLWIPPGFSLIGLMGGQMIFGLAVSIGLAFFLRGQMPVSRQTLRTLLDFVPAGLAIGILSPVAMAWARTEIANSLSWHAVGQIQAIWRASDWITAIMAGLLNAYFLPRLSTAADPSEFAAELRQAISATALPAAVLLTALWLLLPEAMALLYRTDIGVTRDDSLYFLLGDWVRILSWIALFGLFARRSAWAITVGEVLSLPLFATLLATFAGQYGLREAGMIWLATYTAYAGFNWIMLWRSTRKPRAAEVRLDEDLPMMRRQ